MTKNEFKYVTGISDEEQLENLMLLGGDEEPETGDWIEIMKKWYEDMVRYSNRQEERIGKLDRIWEKIDKALEAE